MLVGCLISSHPLNKYAFHITFKAIWSFAVGISIQDIDCNTFLFIFPMANDKGSILSHCIWNFWGFHMILQLWHLGQSLFEFDLEYTAFWLQIQGLALKLMSFENATKIGKVMGNIPELDYFTCVDYSSNLGASPKKSKFLKVKIEVKISTLCKKISIFLAQTSLQSKYHSNMNVYLTFVTPVDVLVIPIINWHSR